MTAKPKALDRIDWSLLLFLSLLWGGAYFFAGVAVREVPPLTVVFGRVALAALVLLPLFWRFGHGLPRSIAEWTPFIGMGLLNNVLPFSLIFAGQTYIGVGLSSIINAMTPLFTVLVMASVHEERLTANRLIGVILGVVGVAVLRGIDGPFGGEQTIGILLCMAAALSYGLAALWGRRKLASVPPLKSATCQLLCSAAIMAVLASAIDHPWTLPRPSVEAVSAIAALAVFGTAVAYIVFFKILVRAGAGNVMLVTLLIPVSAIALGGAFLGEAISPREIAGAGIIGLGLLFIDGRLLARAGRRP